MPFKPNVAYSVLFESSASMRVLAPDAMEAQRIAREAAEKISGQEAPAVVSIRRVVELDPEEED